MASLLAPQPIRLAISPVIVDLEGHSPLSPHVGRAAVDDEDPFAPSASALSVKPPSVVSSAHQYLLPPPRISSKRPKFISKSPTPCSSIKTPSTKTPRSPRRRRHATHTRASCGFPPRNPAVFDTLPWISALDSSESVDPWNIADLSQLPVGDSPRDGGNLGPIRRRKTSASRADAVRSLSLEGSVRLEAAPLAPPARDVMQTPPPRFPSASHVQFYNLMPVWSPRTAV